MFSRTVRTSATAIVALAVVLSMAVGPAMAAQDDGGLLGGGTDDGTLTGETLTGDSGVDVGTDGVSVGGDSGVSVGTDGVSVGGDQGVNVSTDGVSVAGQEVGPDAVSGDGGTPSLPGSDTVPVTTDGSNLEVGGDSGVSVGTGGVSVAGKNVDRDAISGGDLAGGSLSNSPTQDLSTVSSGSTPGIGSLVGPEGALDTDDADLDLSRVDVLGPAPNFEGNTLTDALSVSTEELPATTEQLPTNELPSERVPGVEALPVGSESQISCKKPIQGGDLPTEAVPTVRELPVNPPTIPGVPLALLTPDAVGALAVGAIPDPCTVYDPDNPSVDPTDPPTSPEGSVDVYSLRASDELAEIAGGSEGQLAEGGPAYDSFSGLLVEDDAILGIYQLDVTDGRTEGYLGAELFFAADRDLSEAEGSATVSVLGKSVGGGLDCGDVTSSSVAIEEPTGPCNYDVKGVIEPPLGPAGLIDTIQNPPELPVPGISDKSLPINL